jgi:putative transposase
MAPRKLVQLKCEFSDIKEASGGLTMKKGRYTEEQIIGILKEGEAGVAVKELSRKYGICGKTYYRWKANSGGLEVSEARRLRQLEEENRRLKHLAAEQMLDIQVLKGVLAKGSEGASGGLASWGAWGGRVAAIKRDGARTTSWGSG